MSDIVVTETSAPNNSNSNIGWWILGIIVVIGIILLILYLTGVFSGNESSPSPAPSQNTSPYPSQKTSPYPSQKTSPSGTVYSSPSGTVYSSPSGTTGGTAGGTTGTSISLSDFEDLQVTNIATFGDDKLKIIPGKRGTANNDKYVTYNIPNGTHYFSNDVECGNIKLYNLDIRNYLIGMLLFDQKNEDTNGLKWNSKPDIYYIGQYTFDNDNGDGNDKYDSIQVNPGFKVTIYSDYKGTGEWVQIQNNSNTPFIRSLDNIVRIDQNGIKINAYNGTIINLINAISSIKVEIG